MWLLDVRTERLVEFVPDAAPPYVILSHTWGENEVLFRDLRGPSTNYKTRESYRKVTFTCTQALEDGFNYAWIDTLCIDKSSSAELSESINSMYKWYRDAAVCYAYLADVTLFDESPASIDLGNSINQSRWFTRGWTLQELLAPRAMIFFDHGWSRIGNRAHLANEMSLITGISSNIISGKKDARSVSVAQRMSWAAKRKTTRVEDLAYCLLGIFDVSMPMLYGEGTKSFLRLQEEIIKTTDDQSLFAWTDTQTVDGSKWHGLLAESPAMFAGCGTIVSFQDWGNVPLVSMTGVGVAIDLPLVHFDGKYFEASLNCCLDTDKKQVYIALVGITGWGKQFARIHTNRIEWRDRRKNLRPHRIYVRQEPTVPRPGDVNVGVSIIIENRGHTLSAPYLHSVLSEAWGRLFFAQSNIWTITETSSRLVCALKFLDPSGADTSFLLIGGTNEPDQMHYVQLFNNSIVDILRMSVNDLDTERVCFARLSEQYARQFRHLAHPLPADSSIAFDPTDQGSSSIKRTAGKRALQIKTHYNVKENAVLLQVQQPNQDAVFKHSKADQLINQNKGETFRLL